MQLEQNIIVENNVSKPCKSGVHYFVISIFVSGNVHGGTIMSVIDEAGSIAALKHCQDATNPNKFTVALARVDRISFEQPMFVGEVNHTIASVSYTSARSIEVTCNVFAENLVTGEKRQTNEARLWYVPVIDIVDEEVGSGYGKVYRKKIVVPKTMKQYSSSELQEGGKDRYNSQKKARALIKRLSQQIIPEHTRSITLAQLVLPDDCFQNQNVKGGTILKLIDNAAGIVAFRHARSNAVTALIEALDFVRPIYLGQLIELEARLTYVSPRSMDIRVDVYAESPTVNDRYLAVTANLVFVGLNEESKAMMLPEMTVPTDPFLKREYDLAKARRENRKK